MGTVPKRAQEIIDGTLLCEKCNTRKPVNQFYKNAQNKTHGYRNQCIACFKARNTKWRWEKIKERLDAQAPIIAIVLMLRDNKKLIREIARTYPELYALYLTRAHKVVMHDYEKRRAAYEKGACVSYHDPVDKIIRASSQALQ